MGLEQDAAQNGWLPVMWRRRRPGWQAEGGWGLREKELKPCFGFSSDWGGHGHQGCMSATLFGKLSPLEGSR